MDLINQFTNVRKNFLETDFMFPKKKVGEALCGVWDIKCVLSHIAGWDKYFTMIARLLITGKDVPFRGDKIEQFNQAYVMERENRNWDEVLDEFVHTGEEFINEYSAINDELWNRPFWPQREPTPVWMLNHNKNHYTHHLEEINKKLIEWEPQKYMRSFFRN